MRYSYFVPTDLGGYRRPTLTYGKAVAIPKDEQGVHRGSAAYRHRQGPGEGSG